MASGALAAHFAAISGRNSPSFVGRSKYSGGFLGFGDHAAASASTALAPKSALAASAWVCTASAGVPRPALCAVGGERQHGLITYRLKKTAALSVPLLRAPTRPME